MGAYSMARVPDIDRHTSRRRERQAAATESEKLQMQKGGGGKDGSRGRSASGTRGPQHRPFGYGRYD